LALEPGVTVSCTIVPQPPHCLGWARDRWHSGNELDEAVKSYSRYSEVTSVPRLFDIWQGYPTPPSRSSS
jgi:hypothetical protein